VILRAPSLPSHDPKKGSTVAGNEKLEIGCTETHEVIMETISIDDRMEKHRSFSKILSGDHTVLT
tara:strand:+ start:126 stop:320 length:195 start_codon:yes stop_codon:yes gene_type:complete